MANWAKLQEDIIGKRVVKRAKHGIHFDNGDGQILAHFSGKPCHYEEGGIWKPIDTGLLLAGDGWYGSPHSDVRIHPNGQVKVTGSDYKQFAELPSAKKGVLAGDRIIRTFPGGEQHLIMTEDGFRQEIHVEKPTFPLEKFIARQTGNLPSKYTASPLTAMDAEDNVYVFTGNVKEFGDWLDGAVYPVTIDPDFSTTSTAGDCTLTSYTRNDGARTFFSTTYPAHLIRFDLSSISSAATCTAATLVFTIDSVTLQSRTKSFIIYKITDANGDWIEGTGITKANAKSGEPTRVAKFADGSGGTTTAWAGSQDLGTAGTDYVNTALANTITLDDSDSVGDTYTFTFNGDGLAVLQDWFGDVTNNGFLCRSATNITVNLATSENATESYRPVLTVTYTGGSAGVPKHFLHYARLRSN